MCSWPAVVREFYRGYAEHVATFISVCCPDLPAEVWQARAETFVGLVEGAALTRSEITRAAGALLSNPSSSGCQPS